MNDVFIRPMTLDRAAVMSRRQGAGIKLVITVAIGGLFVFGLYTYHDQQTRLKKADENAEKMRQQHDSLSAQLQVVYEHKSRLEKSLKQEESSHKKTREDLSADKSDAVAKHQRERDDLMGRISSINQQHKMIQSQHEDVQAELARVEGEKFKVEEDHKRESEQHNIEYQSLRQEADNELSRLRDEVANFKRRNIELSNQADKAIQARDINQHQIEVVQQEMIRENKKAQDYQLQVASYVRSLEEKHAVNLDLQLQVDSYVRSLDEQHAVNLDLQAQLQQMKKEQQELINQRPEVQNNNPVVNVAQLPKVNNIDDLHNNMKAEENAGNELVQDYNARQNLKISNNDIDNKIPQMPDNIGNINQNNLVDNRNVQDNHVEGQQAGLAQGRQEQFMQQQLEQHADTGLQGQGHRQDEQGQVEDNQGHMQIAQPGDNEHPGYHEVKEAEQPAGQDVPLVAENGNNDGAVAMEQMAPPAIDDNRFPNGSKLHDKLDDVHNKDGKRINKTTSSPLLFGGSRRQVVLDSKLDQILKSASEHQVANPLQEEADVAKEQILLPPNVIDLPAAPAGQGYPLVPDNGNNAGGAEQMAPPVVDDNPAHVIAAPGVEGVVAAPVIEGVVAAPNLEGVVAAPVVEGVVAAPVVEGVVAAPVVEGVVAAPVVEGVVAAPDAAADIANNQVNPGVAVGAMEAPKVDDEQPQLPKSKLIDVLRAKFPKRVNEHTL